MPTLHAKTLNELKDMMHPMLDQGFRPYVAYQDSAGTWIAVMQQSKVDLGGDVAPEVLVWMAAKR